jgi:phage tail sheath protein FI
MSTYHHGVRVIEVTEGTRPIRTVNTAVVGIVGTAPSADPSVFPLNTPVLIAGSRTKAAKLDTLGTGLGTLPGSMDAIFDQIAPMIVVVRVEEGADDAATQSNVIGTVDAAGTFTGLQALLAAKTKVSMKPRIIGAPGFSHNQPVAAELASIAEKLKAFAYADLASATAEEAVTARNLHSSKRMMLLWPGFEVWSTTANGLVNLPASAIALGLRSKTDNDTGWHKTLSNLPINGVSGLTADVDWDLQNPNTKAGYLNQNDITTMIVQDGFRFWGSRTCSGDPKFAFESATRTGDILADTIADGHMWAVDKPMSSVLIADILEGINAKFRQLKAQGYIVDANAYVDPEINGIESLEAGQLWINYDYTPVPPLEQLGFNAAITNKYLVQLLPKAA